MIKIGDLVRPQGDTHTWTVTNIITGFASSPDIAKIERKYSVGEAWDIWNRSGTHVATHCFINELVKVNPIRNYPKVAI